MSFNFFSLDYLYYPVSGIMWAWHKVFGSFMGADNAWAWVLSVIFLVFTLRSLLFKPFMKQMDSQLKMQGIQPQMKKLRAKYKDDRQRLAEEMMKLNKENGVSAVGGCLPALIQAPVFIGLFHVLRSFQPVFNEVTGQYGFRNEVYFFGPTDVKSFGLAKLFGGAPLGGSMAMEGSQLQFMGGDHTTIIWVGIPLTILAGIATHLTSRRSVNRQREINPDAASAPQAAIMNKLMLYVFPAFVVVGGPFFPLAILFYWLANNSWTFGQLFVAHRLQDKRKALAASVVVETKQAQRFSKPKPGARPDLVKSIDPGDSSAADATAGPVDAAADTDPAEATEATEARNGAATSTGKGAATSRPRPPAKPAPGARPAGGQQRAGSRPSIRAGTSTKKKKKR